MRVGATPASQPTGLTAPLGTATTIPSAYTPPVCGQPAGAAAAAVQNGGAVEEGVGNGEAVVFLRAHDLMHLTQPQGRIEDGRQPQQLQQQQGAAGSLPTGSAMQQQVAGQALFSEHQVSSSSEGASRRTNPGQHGTGQRAAETWLITVRAGLGYRCRIHIPMRPHANRVEWLFCSAVFPGVGALPFQIPYETQTAALQLHAVTKHQSIEPCVRIQGPGFGEAC